MHLKIWRKKIMQRCLACLPKVALFTVIGIQRVKKDWLADSPVPDDHHLVGLDELILEVFDRLEVPLLAHLMDGVHEELVVGLGQLDAGEEIGDDAIEQGDVVGQELGQVHVYDGPQQLWNGKCIGLNYFSTSVISVIHIHVHLNKVW